eukprot:SAG31_NODE_1031_length_10234_cov_6.100049_5_plen_116_part_00
MATPMTEVERLHLVRPLYSSEVAAHGSKSCTYLQVVHHLQQQLLEQSQKESHTAALLRESKMQQVALSREVEQLQKKGHKKAGHGHHRLKGHLASEGARPATAGPAFDASKRRSS